MPQLQIKTIDMKAIHARMSFNSFSLYITGTNAGEFFFFQNTDNAETLYVYRMLESILVKICR